MLSPMMIANANDCMALVDFISTMLQLVAACFLVACLVASQGLANACTALATRMAVQLFV
jgi:hypothetical protein